jgi:hypothetical protein
LNCCEPARVYQLRASQQTNKQLQIYKETTLLSKKYTPRPPQKKKKKKKKTTTTTTQSRRLLATQKFGAMLQENNVERMDV